MTGVYKTVCKHLFLKKQMNGLSLLCMTLPSRCRSLLNKVLDWAWERWREDSTQRERTEWLNPEKTSQRATLLRPRHCLYHTAKWSPCLLALSLSTHQIFITSELQAKRIGAEIFFSIWGRAVHIPKPLHPCQVQLSFHDLLTNNYTVGG